MNIEKIVDKAMVVVGNDKINVKGSIGQTQLVVGIRQLLLLAGGGLVTSGTVTNDQLQQIVGAVITIGVVLFGQFRARREKAERIVMADSLLDDEAEVKK